MVDVRAPHRPRMEGERPHLRAPGDDRKLGGADLVGVASRGELDPRRFNVFRRSFRDPLLVEGVALVAVTGRNGHAFVHAFRPPLEGRRSLAEGPHDPVTYG